MNFQHSLEQTLLKSSAATAFGRLTPNEDCATALRDLGVVGLMVPEEGGGSSLGFVEAAIVLQEAGCWALRYPLAETVLLARHVLAAYPSRAEQVLAGEASIVAAAESNLRLDDGRVKGSMRVPVESRATWIFARVEAGRLALIPAELFDGIRRPSIEPGMHQVQGELDLPLQKVLLLSDDGYDSGMAVLRCAELLGAAERCFEMGVGYLKDRWQFGAPIGANQALKHMAADSYLALENCRVAVEYAASAMDQARLTPLDPDIRSEAETAVEVMLAYVPGAAREIAETAIQFHGGIGLTWEYPLNQYLRHIVRLGMILGRPDRHRECLASRLLGRPKTAGQGSGERSRVVRDPA